MSFRNGVRLAATLLGLFVAGFFTYLANVKHASALRPRYCVLIVGNFSNAGSFARQASDGIRLAYYTGRYSEGLDLDSLDTSAISDALELRRAVLEKMARRHVLCFLSCQNSPDLPPLLELSSGFRIPSLLVVATNKGLQQMVPHALFIRMPPADDVQAETLAGSADSVAAILHENNNYGNGLGKDLLEALRRKGRSPLSFALEPGMEEFAILREIAQDDIRTVYYLGYFERVDELISKLQLVRFRGRLILSDGCFPGPRAAYDGLSVSLCFPAFQDSIDALSGLRGFAIYGYDAMRLVGESVLRPPLGPVDHQSLVPSILQVAASNVDGERVPLRHAYRFSSDGENLASHFIMHECAVPGAMNQ